MTQSPLHQPSHPGHARHGLTLIELIVVLMILIALASLLVPMLPSMLTRAHTSTMTTNSEACATAILTYNTLYNGMPNNFDALGDGTTIINYMANGSMCPPQYLDPPSISAGPANNELQPLTLTAAEAAALQGVGISQLQAMVTSATYGQTQTLVGYGQPANTFDPTFSYYSAATPALGAITVAQGTVLAGLDPTAQGPGSTTYTRCVVDNFPLTGRYVCLGIGPRCSMVGKTIQSAPVFFGDMPVINPEYAYGRFVAIFKVSDSAVGPNFTQAELVGASPMHDTGLDNIDSHIQGWYQLTTGGS